MLALDDPASMSFGVADDEGEFAAIRLRLCTDSLSLVFGELLGVLGVFLVMDTIQVLSNDLAVLCLRRLFD